MSPMSLLNLPAESLRHDAMPRHDETRGSTHGERAERRLGLWVAGAMLAVIVGICIGT